MKLLVVAALLLHILHSGTANPVYAPAGKLEFGTVLAVDSSNCPPGYSQPANSNWTTCYKISDNSLNKKSAAVQCSSSNGTLASVPNAFVNSFLYYLASQNDATDFWLGIECFNGDKSLCANDDGSPLTYNNFSPVQPNFDGSCVYMSMVGRDTQLWSSFDCGQRFQFACEAAALRQGCPLNYKPFQSMCYNYVFVSSSNKISANYASTICKQVAGGRLAIVPNAQVNSFLVSIKPNSPTSWVAFGLTCSNIKSNGDRSSCKWDDGTTFSYQAFSDATCPSAPTGTSTIGNGCCDFNNGHWASCYNGDYIRFDSYICQAPMH